MTVEIRRKIADAAITYSKDNSPKQVSIPAYHDGANFGYSLASAELEAANQRISDLQAELLFERSAVELKNKRIKELEEGLGFLQSHISEGADAHSIIDQLLNK